MKKALIVGIVACYIGKLADYIVYYSTGKTKTYQLFTLPETARLYMATAKVTDELHDGVVCKIYSGGANI